MKRKALQFLASSTLLAATRTSSLNFPMVTTASASATPKRTFYQRPLPETCTALSSKEGRALFNSALTSKGLKSFFPLIEQHSTQSEPAYCGVSTLTICLNAFAVDPRQTWKGPWRWYEESMLNCCVDMEEIKTRGITMKTFNCLAICQGLATNVQYVDDPESTLENFRNAVRQACVESDDDGNESDDDRLRDILVVSYSRRVLGQTGTGHFSPIAAYDEHSDSVLIMDTARFKYGSHWVSLPLLYEAMKPIDPDTGRSRGYIMLMTNNDDDEEEHQHANLPVSVLLRSKMKQDSVRLKYKEYLANLDQEVSWEQVLRYFTKDFAHPQYVWQMTEPQLKPCEGEHYYEETVDMIGQVRSLIADLMPSSEPKVPSLGCSGCFSRTLDLRTEEAMFIVFLASLDPDRRKEIIFDQNKSSASEEARMQLVAEAELIQYAIDISGEVDRD